MTPVTLKSGNGFGVVNLVDNLAQHLGGLNVGSPGATPLTEQELQPVLVAASKIWAGYGIDAAQLQILANADVRIVDLASNLANDLLAQTYSGTNIIEIDKTARGLGWYTNVDGQPLAGTVDLLTVVTHELGHLLGFNDIDQPGDVESAYLSPGVRQLSAAAEFGGSLKEQAPTIEKAKDETEAAFLTEVAMAPPTATVSLDGTTAAVVNTNTPTPLPANPAPTLHRNLLDSLWAARVVDGKPVQESLIDAVFAERGTTNLDGVEGPFDSKSS
jgi:hypothetical protein